MAEGALLLRRLRHVRRRARGLAALEGAVAGLALATAAVAGLRLVARARSGVLPWRPALAGAAAGALIGFVVGAARRVSLARCARLVDAALDRGGVPRDRVLSALSFVEGPATPFARAAITDALGRARALRPALVAPARPPRAWPGLAAGLAALALVGAWPVRAPGSVRGGGVAPLARAAAPRLKVGAAGLDFEREAARDARETARRDHDEELAALADELRATLEALTVGGLERGAALERLSALAARARDAADESARERAGVRAAGATLERTPTTRGAGRALVGADPSATEQALRELAAAAASARADERGDIARAFSGAAASARETSDGEGAASEESARRRLRRDAETPGGDAAASARGPRRRESERRLERLRRDLDDTAAACRAEPAACRRGLEDHAGSLADAQRGAAGTEARRRLESAVSQLRERLRRGNLDGRARGTGERAFQRAARGGESGDGERVGGEPTTASGEAESTEGVAGDDPQAASGEAGDEAGPGEGATGAAAGESEGAARGAGIGRNPGGDPLGGRDALGEARGHERQARVRDGAGPTRAEVIEAAARRGFAATDYVRVFGDYAPVAEEAVVGDAVPEGRRYVVRRYFQLIRPRARAERTP